ncbi:hypothetical protein CTZ27_18270 [Streptomyces griseocarneus]|nr:hypothetical protein CTZ27_18270 [Streptomyces griseocarneus]
MKSRTFRLAPVVVAVTAGLLTGTVGAAVAAPSEESPSATSSAASSPTGSAPSGQENEPAKDSWKKRGHYDDENSCRKAGEEGQSRGKWHDYKCERAYDHGDYRSYWWLYTH